MSSTGDGADALKRPARGELRAYYVLVALYFFAFGLQFVLYPSLAAFALGAGSTQVGVAVAALQAPMVAFLLFAGVSAERVQAGPALSVLHLAFAAPPVALAVAAASGVLTYSGLIIYALAMGSIAAFMLPIRDAALNGVVSRSKGGADASDVAQAATTATAVQIGAQIAGILLAWGHEPIGRALAPFAPAPTSAATLGIAALLAFQALVSLIGALLALNLRAPKAEPRAGPWWRAFADVGLGLRYALKDRVMAPMLISAAVVGMFVIGSFQVLFPLIVRESYAGGAQELSLLYAGFWSASFLAAVTLGRIGPLQRPGRAMLLSHSVGAVVLASFAVDKPLWAFFALAGVWGLSAGVAIANSRAITQSAADPRFLGRVLAVYSLGFMGAAPIGAALAGYGAELIGPRLAALVPAAGLIVSVLALAIFSPIWTLRRGQDGGLG